MAQLAQEADSSIRSADKELELFDPPGDFFGLDAGLFNLNGDNAFDPSSADDVVAHLFEPPPPSSSMSESIDTSPMPDWGVWDARQSAEGAWQKTLRCFEQNPASPLPDHEQAAVYPDSGGRAGLSDPELFIVDNAVSSPQIPQSPFWSAPPSPTRPSLPTSRASSKTHGTVNNTPCVGTIRHSSIVKHQARRPSRSVSMMRSSAYRPGHEDIWAKRLEAAADKLSIQVPLSVLPVSPPPSAKVKQEEQQQQQQAAYDMGQSSMCLSTISMDDPSYMDAFAQRQQQYQLTPLSSPNTERSMADVLPCQNGHDANAAHFINNPFDRDALQALVTPPATGRLCMTPWGTDTGDYAFSSPDFHSPRTQQQQQQQQAFWQTPVSAGHSTPNQASMYANGRINSTFSVTNASTDLATSGLMIQCAGGDSLAGLSDPSTAFAAEPPYASSPSLPFGFQQPQATATHTTPAQTYPHPRAAAAAAARMASRTPSPPSASRSRRPSSRNARHVLASQAPSAGAGSPAHHAHHLQHPHHLHSPHHLPQNSHHHHHHRRRSSAQPSSQRPVSVGFVNFTPDDSRRILTGVAPSGSSKTKARREKEAADKRRKLSEAAARAVIEAGGDLTALQREGLLEG